MLYLYEFDSFYLSEFMYKTPHNIERQRDNLDKTGKLLIYLIIPCCSRRASYHKNGQKMVAFKPN